MSIALDYGELLFYNVSKKAYSAASHSFNVLSALIVQNSFEKDLNFTPFFY
jgi:hypothetical protein